MAGSLTSDELIEIQNDTGHTDRCGHLGQRRRVRPLAGTGNLASRQLIGPVPFQVVPEQVAQDPVLNPTSFRLRRLPARLRRGNLLARLARLKTVDSPGIGADHQPAIGDRQAASVSTDLELSGGPVSYTHLTLPTSDLV